MKIYFYTAAITIALLSCNNASQNSSTTESKKDTLKKEGAAGNTDEAAPASNEAPAESSASNTFSYDPQVSTITGTITSETFFGPPGFGETPQQDSKEKIFILKPDQPVTVVAPANTDEFNVTRENITEIQLSSPDIQLAPLENKKVKLTGMFFGAHTGHHYTDVLMTVQKADQQ